ncbi:hypothetical protein BH24ACI5_BH24ACI5_17480 [soil metagenome]
MARVLLVSTALLVLLLPAAAQDEAIFRSGVQTVVLHATVRNDAGRLVPDLTATFAGVLEELRHQYEIGYLLPKADGKLHDVSVRLKRTGMTVQARKNYRAPRAR